MPDGDYLAQSYCFRPQAGGAHAAMPDGGYLSESYSFLPLSGGAHAAISANAWSSSVHGAPYSPVSRSLARVSLLFAFLAIALISFDAFPYKIVGGFHPRLSYVLSLAGFTCYLFSRQWTRHLRQHQALLALAGVLLLYGLLSTAINASMQQGQGLLLFTLLNYLERQIMPVGFMLWYAFLFSSLPQEDARKFFIAALLVMFFSNTAHMLLEHLANHGAAEIKNFLIAVNPWFRIENAHWGNWPPVYYENRVRGLFGEPAHMAYAFTPVVAFFLYKLQKNVLYGIPIFFIAFSYGGSTATVTGVLSLGFLAVAFILHFCYRQLFGRTVVFCAVCMLSGLLALGGALYYARDQLPYYTAQWRTLDSIADYCRRAQAEPELPLPDLESRNFSRFFFRALSTRLEWDIARQHPFGVGYQLSGGYRKPLAAWKEEDIAHLLRVRYALERQRDPVPVFPYFCEYTAIAAELGVIALLLFLLLCLYVGRLAYRRYASTGDSFILYMLFALPAFMLTLSSFALRTGLMFYYFLAFLYALGLERGSANAPELMCTKAGSSSAFKNPQSAASTASVQDGGE